MNAVSKRTRTQSRIARVGGLALAVLAGLAIARPAAAQDVLVSSVTSSGVISVALGNSHVVSHPVVIRRVSIANPEIVKPSPYRAAKSNL